LTYGSVYYFIDYFGSLVYKKAYSIDYSTTPNTFGDIYPINNNEEVL